MGIALRAAGAVSLSGSPSFGAPTIAGDLGISWIFSNSGSAMNPYTITAGWTVATPGGGAFDWAAIAFKPNLGAAESPPVWSGAGAALASCAATFSGAAAGQPMGTPVNGGEAGGAVQVATMGAPDPQPGGLIVYCGGWNGGGAGDTISNVMSDSSGAAAAVTSYNDSGGATGLFYNFCWGIAGPSTGGVGSSATGTLSAFANGGCCIAVFAPAGAAPVAVPLPVAGDYERASLRREVIW